MTTVTEHLERRGVRFEVLPHDHSVTALQEARALHADPEEVVKAIVLEIDTGHALAILPATRRLDRHAVAEALGTETVALATEDAIAAHFPEFELGAFPALPSLLRLPTVVDQTVLAHGAVIIAAGSTRESVRVDTPRLLEGATVTIAAISQV
jgi:Ala-tRNA(Pro) deacylase